MEYELADIIKDHLPEINVTPHQYKVLNQIMYCRTPNLGSHVYKCSNPKCNHEEVVFNSCRNRHCPKCQGINQLKWKQKKISELLPIEYSNFNFGIPRGLYGVYQYNNAICYNIIFDSSHKALLEVTKDKIGCLSVVHTSTQKLHFHPHIHCLMPEIEVKNEKNKIISAKKCVIKKEILNTVYKRILKKNLLNAFKRGAIEYPGLTREMIEKSLKNSKNYIYKSTTNDPAKILNYLGDNINKVGLTNKKIKNYTNDNVTYSYVDRTDGNKIKEIDIDATLFLKRFVLHILPNRLTKIRYYGFLSNNNKKLYSELAKYITKTIDLYKVKINLDIMKLINKLLLELDKAITCPCCRIGLMKLSHHILPKMSP